MGASIHNKPYTAQGGRSGVLIVANRRFMFYIYTIGIDTRFLIQYIENVSILFLGVYRVDLIRQGISGKILHNAARTR